MLHLDIYNLVINNWQNRLLFDHITSVSTTVESSISSERETMSIVCKRATLYYSRYLQQSLVFRAQSPINSDSWGPESLQTTLYSTWYFTVQIYSIQYITDINYLLLNFGKIACLQILSYPIFLDYSRKSALFKIC